MPLLTNHEAAQLDIAKLREYCLNTNHPRGRHKARQFAASLGVSIGEAEWLRQNILLGTSHSEALAQDFDEFGQRFRVDMMLTRLSRRAVVRTIWMIRHRETFPRFITCWVL